MTRSQRAVIGRIIGILLFIVLLLEFRGAFVGTRAFIRKPTLVLSPIHAPSFDDREISEIRDLLERELAAGGNHALYPKSLVENFYLERDNAVNVFDGSYRGRSDAFELGKALGVERIAIATVYGSESINLSIAVYDIATDQLAGRVQLAFDDFEGLMSWEDADGMPVDLKMSIGATVPGLSIGARLYLGWLGVLLIPALLLLIGFRPSRILIEGLLGSGLLLSLFSWIYALNGDMDYVQRFVATSGILDIADTAVERAATLWRYPAPVFLMLAAWILDIIERFSRIVDSGASPSASAVIEASSPLWAGLSAVLFALALPNFLVLEGLPVLAWVATAPLYLSLRRVGWGRGITQVLLFTGLQSLLVNWWQGTFSYISLPFTVGLTLLQYVPFVLILVTTIHFMPRTGLWAAPLLWTAFDWLRSMGFLGYPWGLLGVSQYGSPGLIQIASLGGVWMISLLTHYGGATLAMGIEGLLSGERNLSLNRDSLFPRTAALRSWIPLIALSAAVFLVFLGGTVAIRNRDQRSAAAEGSSARNLRILLVQQNTDPRKHDYRLSFEELSRLTDEALETEGPFDLVAWPESGFVPDIRFWLGEGRSRMRRSILVREFLDWQSSAGIALVTGTQDHFYESAPPSDDPEAPGEIKRIRNSSMYLAPGRTDPLDRDYYYKMRLVPFTENFPFGERFPKIAELLHNFSTTQWTPGDEHHVFTAPAFRFSTPICFEDVFPDHVRRFVLNGAEVLVNMSNDYWANTPLEGYQHASHAVFRAVENRRPLVRSTCSGWTISVDSEGRIAEGWPPFYEPGWTVAVHRLPAKASLTLYTRFGDWFPVLCALAFLILVSGELIFGTGSRIAGRRGYGKT